MEISKHIIKTLWPLKVGHPFHTKAKNEEEEEKHEEELWGGRRRQRGIRKKKEGSGTLIRTARTCRGGETIRFVMRGSSVTERAWGVSGWARMREMRKREVLSCCALRILHIHKHIPLFECIQMHLNQLLLGHAHTQRMEMHLDGDFVHTFCRFFSHAHTHTHTNLREHSQRRRGVNAVGTWFPSLHTHSSLSRGPDRTLCPAGHGYTHTHTHINALLRFNTHAQTRAVESGDISTTIKQ